MPHTDTRPAPVLVRAADATVLDNDPTGAIALLVDTPAAGGALSSHRSTFAPGSPGAPPHVHRRSAELFFMLGGALDVLLDDEIVTLRAGDLLLVPPLTAHAFAPTPGEGAETLFVLAPGVPRDDYYRLLDRVHAGEADPAEIHATQERFDNHYVSSDVWERARAGG